MIDIKDIFKIDPEELKRSIEKYKKENIKHKPDFSFDVTEINGLDGVNMVSQTISKILEDVSKDTELYIICEMAKAYIDGARPVYKVERFKPVRLTRDQIKLDVIYDDLQMVYYHSYITKESALKWGWKEKEV